MRLLDCPVRATADVIDGKWKPMIVNSLKAGPLRFGQLPRDHRNSGSDSDELARFFEIDVFDSRYKVEDVSTCPGFSTFTA